IAEAAVFGVPAIASAIEAQVEIVADGGILFQPGNAQALASAMATLAGDPGLRQRLGAAAKERAERSFLIARNISEFEQAYDRLLARSRSSYGWIGSWSWPAAYTHWAGGMIERRLARLVRMERPERTTAAEYPPWSYAP
ncbi:MAG: glycosyltransferase, partial [Gemmatimonadaceae bacterium]